MRVREVRMITGGMGGGGREFRTMELEEGAPLPEGAFFVGPASPLHPWLPEHLAPAADDPAPEGAESPAEAGTEEA